MRSNIIFLLLIVLLISVGCTSKKVLMITPPQPYGEMWVHNDTGTGFFFIIGSQNQWFNLTGFDKSESGRTLNGFTHAIGSNSLIVEIDGLYDSSISISTGNVGNNQEYQFTLSVNGVQQSNVEAHRKIGAAGDVGSAADRGFLRLNKGDNITFSVRNNDGTANLAVHAASIELIKIGD